MSEPEKPVTGTIQTASEPLLDVLDQAIEAAKAVPRQYTIPQSPSVPTRGYTPTDVASFLTNLESERKLGVRWSVQSVRKVAEHFNWRQGEKPLMSEYCYTVSNQALENPYPGVVFLYRRDAAQFIVDHIDECRVIGGVKQKAVKR